MIHFELTEEKSKGGLRPITEALTRLYKPINLHYAINSDLLFEKAGQLGITLMYSGFGGDEGISNQGNGYWNELISNGQHALLRKEIKSMVYRHGGVFYKRLMKCYVNYYVPWVFIPFMKDWRKEIYRSFAIEKSLARKYRMRRRFFQTNPPPVKPDVRAMQYFRLMYPNIPERMEETALLAQQHGLEYRYPFLDVKLVEFFYSLPSEYKFRDGMGRYLFRQIMDGILPDKIRMRTHKSGTTIPNVFARVFTDRERFQKMIDQSRQRNRYHYVDYDKLQTMLDILKNKEAFKEEDFDLRAFQSAMSVLILQQWQRDGKIDIGISC
jgi:asparagine synthase (glutamine-hydrolysing)